MQRVGIITLGNWSTALGQHLACKGVSVLGWAKEPEIVNKINAEHVNPKYLTSIRLRDNLKATHDLNDLAECSVIVVACPSYALEEIFPRIPQKAGALWISAIKGFVGKDSLTPLQYLSSKVSQIDLAVLSGPSFAKDVAVQSPVSVVSASRSEAVALKAAELFSSEAMRVYVSQDTLGVELGGILKNVIALAVGVSDGLNLGESAKAGLITRGLAEIVRLSVAMGAQEKTLFGLSGLGDLAMTATCNASRNRTVGLRLGGGETLQQIITSLGSVAEGVKNTPQVLALAQKHNVYMPISESVGRLLSGTVTARQVLTEMMSKGIKTEW